MGLRVDVFCQPKQICHPGENNMCHPGVSMHHRYTDPMHPKFLSVSDLKKADVLFCFKDTSFLSVTIALLEGYKYSHCMIYTGKKESEFIEAGLRGIRLLSLREFARDHHSILHVYRYRNTETFKLIGRSNAALILESAMDLSNEYDVELTPDASSSVYWLIAILLWKKGIKSIRGKALDLLINQTLEGLSTTPGEEKSEEKTSKKRPLHPAEFIYRSFFDAGFDIKQRRDVNIVGSLTREDSRELEILSKKLCPKGANPDPTGVITRERYEMIMDMLDTALPQIRKKKFEPATVTISDLASSPNLLFSGVLRPFTPPFQKF